MADETMKPVENQADTGGEPEAPSPRRFEDLPPAAQRALKEAEERRKAAANAPAPEKEYGGRKEGLEPVRYGDWEKKGIAVDF